VTLSGILVVAESGVKLQCVAWTLSCVQHLKRFGTVTKMPAVLKSMFYNQFTLSILICTLLVDETMQAESHLTDPPYIYSQRRDLVL
jgi:hypothetical protein